MSSEVERRDGCKYLFIAFLQSGLPSNHICTDPICTCCCYLRIWPLVTPTLLCSSVHSILCTSGAYASKIYAKSLQCTFWTCCVSSSFNCGPLHQRPHLYHHPELQFHQRGNSTGQKKSVLEPQIQQRICPPHETLNGLCRPDFRFAKGGFPNLWFSVHKAFSNSIHTVCILFF